MFDDVIRSLRRMEHGIRIPIELKPDDDGYLDRKCPNPLCDAAFKVHFEDWRDKVPDDGVHCPICGLETQSTEWNTPDQSEHSNAAALRYVQKELGDAFTRDARRLNQSQGSRSFVRMTMSYRPSPLPILVPAEASEVMRQKSACEECGCRYSSVGAAFFCPACGHNSAASTFDAAVETVRRTLDALPKIREALTEAADKDIAEDSARHICENVLAKLVGAFQRFAEALYDATPNAQKLSPRRNAFQNLQESSELWRSAIGLGYADMLTASQLSALERFFQQRHLLAHNDGIVDQTYLDRSGDSSYAAGQRLVVRSETVRELADLVSRLATELRRHLPDA